MIPRRWRFPIACRVFLCLACVILFAGPCGAQADLAEASQRIIAAANAFRATQGLEALSRDPDLAAAARYFAQAMARTGTLSHSADGTTPAARAEKFGYIHCIIAENIGYQFSSRDFSTEELAARLFEGWQRSPEHRGNLLDAHVIHTAVELARSPKTGTYYAVHLFASPKLASIRFSIENRTSGVIRYTLDRDAFSLEPLTTRTHERCRPSTLAAAGTTVATRNGQQLSVDRVQGELRLVSN